MKNEIGIQNFKTFVVNNIKLIIVSSLIFGGLFFIGSFITGTDESEETSIEEELIREELIADYSDRNIDELEQEELEEFKSVLHEEGYYFRVYLEHFNYGAFTSSYLVEEILYQKEALEYVSTVSGLEFEEFPPEIAVSVTSQNSSVIHEVQVSTNDEDFDREMASAYLDLFNNEGISFLEDRRVYVLSEEPIENTLLKDDFEETTNIVDDSSNLINKVVFMIIGLALGILFGIVAAFIYQLFSKVINEFYEFRLTENDLIVDYSFDKFSNKTNVVHSILYPSNRNKVIIFESNLSTQKEKEILENTPKVDRVNDVNELNTSNEYDEIIILIERFHTHKDWYKVQRKQLEIYNSIVKIIII